VAKKFKFPVEYIALIGIIPLTGGGPKYGAAEPRKHRPASQDKYIHNFFSVKELLNNNKSQILNNNQGFANVL